MIRTLLSLACLVALTSGCAAALVGGGAAGGYYVGTDERSLGTITDDGLITSKIKTLYGKDSTVKALDINIDTYNGNVTLNGRVKSQAVANRAVTLARSVKGVKSVTSKLTIVP